MKITIIIGAVLTAAAMPLAAQEDCEVQAHC